MRRQILAEFTRLGLVDVATDYGLVLLAFTSRGLPLLEIKPAGEAFVGTEEAVKLDWAQRTGGALEFRGRKVARRPLAGSIWIRKSDGMPLRIFAWFEHEEPKHTLRDEASVDYVVSAMGFPVPATVVHRHYVDGQGLTENLYTYEPFRLFTTDTNDPLLRHHRPEMTPIIYLHGFASGPASSKARYFREYLERAGDPGAGARPGRRGFRAPHPVKPTEGDPAGCRGGTGLVNRLQHGRIPGGALCGPACGGTAAGAAGAGFRFRAALAGAAGGGRSGDAGGPAPGWMCTTMRWAAIAG